MRRVRGRDERESVADSNSSERTFLAMCGSTQKDIMESSNIGNNLSLGGDFRYVKKHSLGNKKGMGATNARDPSRRVTSG
jgi:hypothetical protein